ncbi:MAG: DUF2520 domain-containing protein [candidate division WOR-3 bacterium]
MSASGPKQSLTRVGFVGAGRVGTALAWHCRKAGFGFAGLTDRDLKQAQVAYQRLGLRFRRLESSELAQRSDVLFLTVPDRAVASVFQAARPLPGTIVAHCSGALGLEVFEDYEAAGLEVLALHPVQVFASYTQAIRSLPGSWWALDGSEKGMAFGRRLVRLLRGRAVTVRSEVRPAWHAACVFASNFQAALFDAVERIGPSLGMTPGRIVEILTPLARAALESVLRHGPVRALTGPVERGDAETVNSHLAALARVSPELVPMYRELSRRLVELARSRKQNAES